jgi:hypothetical protein
MSDIEIEIPQKSSILLILFLIYIRFLFAERSNTNKKILSYLNNIGLVVSLNSIKKIVNYCRN